MALPAQEEKVSGGAVRDFLGPPDLPSASSSHNRGLNPLNGVLRMRPGFLIQHALGRPLNALDAPDRKYLTVFDRPLGLCGD
jgi:hypothetical protein